VRTLDTSLDPPATVVRVSTPFGDESRLLAQDGRPLRVERASGARVDFEYRQGSLAAIKTRCGDAMWALSVDGRGGRVSKRVSAEDAGKPGQAIDAGAGGEAEEAAWALDATGRLQEIRLPDGRRWLFAYEPLVTGEKNGRAAGVRVTVTAK
jgi:hypothetical protein